MKGIKEKKVESEDNKGALRPNPLRSLINNLFVKGRGRKIPEPADCCGGKGRGKFQPGSGNSHSRGESNSFQGRVKGCTYCELSIEDEETPSSERRKEGPGRRELGGFSFGTTGGMKPFFC